MLDPTPTITELGISPEAAETLLPHIDSFAKWELLRFLNDNPSLEATVEDLARYTGRDETELKPAARSMVGAGLFRQSEGLQGYLYALTDDERLRELIAHLVDGFVADRLIRIAISSHILKARRNAPLLTTDD